MEAYAICLAVWCLLHAKSSLAYLCKNLTDAFKMHYIFLLAALFFLFCVVGSGYSPIEDDEDVYARNIYKGECFAYILMRIICCQESFFLFLLGA